MKLTLKNPDKDLLAEVGKKVKKGETCIYPTETCYGLGTNALDAKAVEKIYDIKRRSTKDKLSCVVSSLEQAERYCNLNETEREICERFMPGPLTLVAEKKKNVPDILNEDFVFRISSNEIATKLAEEADVPIVATSANFSGADNNYSVKDISRITRETVDIVLDVGTLEKNNPSTVIKVEDRDLKIFREGPVSREEIERFLSI